MVTWATFAPCLLWIFLGAPFLEHLRTNVRLTNALTPITAAIIGVVLNLARSIGILPKQRRPMTALAKELPTRPTHS